MNNESFEERNIDNVTEEVVAEEPTKKVTWGIKIPADKKEELDKIKELCGSGEEAADSLIRAFRLVNAGTEHVDRQTEVETFVHHINCIQDAFVRSLNTCDEVREAITKTKDEIIANKEKDINIWRERADASNALAVESNTAAMEAENKMNAAEKAAKEAEDQLKEAQAALKDKEKINSTLESKLAEAEAKLTDYPELSQRAETLYKEKELLEREYESYKKDADIAQERAVAAMQKELDQERSEHESVVHNLKLELANKIADKDKELLALSADKKTLEREYETYKKDAEVAKERAVADVKKELEQERGMHESAVRELKLELSNKIAEKDKELAKIIAEKETAVAATELKVEKEKSAEVQKLRDKVDELKDERAELKNIIAELKAQIAKHEATEDNKK